MDIDVKISTKHYKIEPNIVLKSIYHNRLGFISSMQRWVIIQIAINITHYTTGESEERERKEGRRGGRADLGELSSGKKKVIFHWNAYDPLAPNN